MVEQKRHISFHGLILAVLVFMNAIIVQSAYTESEEFYWLLVVTAPVLIMFILSLRQK